MQIYTIALEIVLLLLLLFSLAYMMRLRHNIKSFQNMQGGLQDDLRAFAAASENAQSVFAKIHKAMAEYQAILGSDRKAADDLRDDLRYLVEQGKIVADRLENALHGLRAHPEASATPPKAAPAAPKDKKARAALLKSIENLR